MMSPKEWRAAFTATTLVCASMLLFVPLPVSAGSLDPPANAVDASSNPVPTMRTLNELTPTWSKVLPSNDGDVERCNSSRFKCVFDNRAVLDMETGLVWPRNDYGNGSWNFATSMCHGWKIASKGGWHSPSIQELSSLFPLPADNPFYFIPIVVGDYQIWSSTLDTVNPTLAWTAFSSGGIQPYPIGNNKMALCVRSNN